MINSTSWFVSFGLVCALLAGGCSSEVVSEEQPDAIAEPASANPIAEPKVEEDTATPQVVRGERCNKTCVLECGDCSCCL
jgi:hypothetical protein